MTDLGNTLADTVTAAWERREPLRIFGGDSKRHVLGRDCDGTSLDLSRHRGIIDYQPAELVLTARAGTPLSEIRDTLAKEGQQMPFEPPLFDGQATLGGTLACNLSGPARPWSGSIRDMVLGVELINGKGELLSFGGQVMKNVAGYDVSRLQAGALGTLGVITEISLKVLPEPEEIVTLAYEMDADEAVLTMNRRSAESRPLMGAFWDGGRLYLRIAGAQGAVCQTALDWGGEQIPDTDLLWEELREMRLPFFKGPGELWRLSIASTLPVHTPAHQTLVDWGGAVRWVRGEFDFEELQAMASAAGGHASLFSGGDRQGEVRQRLAPVQQRLHERLKHAFDPHRILNPGRLYSWL